MTVDFGRGVARCVSSSQFACRFGEQEDRAETESDHSIRPVTEREQEDRDGIESDQFIQASPHDSEWGIG